MGCSYVNARVNKEIEEKRLLGKVHWQKQLLNNSETAIGIFLITGYVEIRIIRDC
jgi:hypothetical protein